MNEPSGRVRTAHGRLILDPSPPAMFKRLSLTQRLLTNEASVGWGRGNLSLGARALKWQTLQDTSSPITPPYDRMPQFFGKYTRFDVGGFDYSVDADYTQFHADRARTGHADAGAAGRGLRSVSPATHGRRR